MFYNAQKETIVHRNL